MTFLQLSPPVSKAIDQFYSNTKKLFWRSFPKFFFISVLLVFLSSSEIAYAQTTLVEGTNSLSGQVSTPSAGVANNAVTLLCPQVITQISFSIGNSNCAGCFPSGFFAVYRGGTQIWSSPFQDGNGQTATYNIPLTNAGAYAFEVNTSFSFQSNWSINATVTGQPDTTNPVITGCPTGDLTASSPLLDDYTSLISVTDDSSTTISQDPSPGSSLISPTTVTLTVTDACGNDVTCAFTVLPSNTDCNAEGFEALDLNDFAWTNDGTPFTTGTANFGVQEYTGFGAGGSDKVIDNINDTGTNKMYSIAISDTQEMSMNSMAIYISSSPDGLSPTNDGSLTVKGILDGIEKFSVTKNSGFPTNPGSNFGFFIWDFAIEGGVDNSTIVIDEIKLVLGGNFKYIAVDNFINCDAINVTPCTVSIGTQPQSQVVCEGEPFSFSVVASGTGTLSYNWQISGNNGASWGDASPSSNGGTSLDFISAGIFGDGNLYRVIVTSDNGTPGDTGDDCSVTSDVSTLTVNPLPTVTAIASVAEVCEGEEVTLTGGGAVSYIWDNGVTDGVAFIPTATATYTVTGTDANECMNTATIEVIVNHLDITCPANIMVDNDAGECGAVVTYDEPTATDNCSTTTTIYGNDTTVVNGSAGCLNGSPMTFTPPNSGVITSVSFFAGNAQAETGSILIQEDTCTNTPVTIGTSDVQTTAIDTWVTWNFPTPVPVIAGNQYFFTSANNCMGFRYRATGDDPTTGLAFIDFPGECDFIDPFDYSSQITLLEGSNTATVAQTAGLPSGSTFPVGTTTNTFEISNGSGGTTTCSFDVTVNDNEPPTITCPADITVDNDAGECGAVVTYDDPTATDNCSATTNVYGNNTPVVDNSGGCLSSEAMTFTPPNSGVITSVSFFAANIQVETGSILIQENSCTTPVTIGTSEVQTTVFNSWVTWNFPTPVAVIAGNQYFFTSANNCMGFRFAATGNDPTTGYANIDDLFGSCNITDQLEYYSQITLLEGSNSVTVAQTSGLPSGSTFPVGTTTNTFEISNGSGGTTTCSFDVTVNDTEPPMITCPADITVDNDAGECGAVVSFDEPTATAGCGATTIIYGNNTTVVNGAGGCLVGSPMTFTPPNSGVITSVSFFMGNAQAETGSILIQEGDCETPITIGTSDVQTTALDTWITWNFASPVPVIAGNQYYFTAENQCMGVRYRASGDDPTTGLFFEDFLPFGCDFDSFDYSSQISVIEGTGTNTTTVAQTAGLPSGSTFPVGTTTNTFEISNGSGGTTTCSFDVTVNDNEPPTITCPADITVDNDAGECGAVVTYTEPTATDNCSTTTAIYGNNTPVVNNSGGCLSFEVMTFTPPNDGVITSVSFFAANIQVETGSILIQENSCTTPVTIGTSEVQTTVFNTWVTWNFPTPVSVIAGNQYFFTSANNCMGFRFAATGNDPTTGYALIDDFFGQCDITDQLEYYSQITLLEGSNSATVAQTAGLPSGSTFPVGTTTNTFEISNGSGGTTTCSFDVTVNGNEPPTITCPDDITVDNDAGECGAVVSFDDPTATEGCGPSASAYGYNGPVVNNSSGGLQYEKMTFTPPNSGVITSVSFFAANISESTGSILIQEGDCETPITIGTSDVQTATFNTWVTWNFTTPVPVIAGNQYYFTSNDSFGFRFAPVDDPTTGYALVDDFIFDDCIISDGLSYYTEITVIEGTGTNTNITQTSGLPSGSLFPVGTTTNTFELTDGSGNTATCSFDVTVNDNEPPTITCPDDITVDNDAGECGAVVTYDMPTATDNCAEQQPAVIESSVEFYTYFNLETGEVCDDIIDCDISAGPEFDLRFAYGGGNVHARMWWNEQYTDMALVYDKSFSEISLLDVQNYYFCEHINDPNAACSNTDTPPTDFVGIFLTNDGNYYKVEYLVESQNSVTFRYQQLVDSNVSVLQTAGLPSGSLFPVGTTTNTFEISDGNNGVTTCSFDVTVNDNEPPVITCPANVSIDNTPGQCYGEVTLIPPTVTDNCSGSSSLGNALSFDGTNDYVEINPLMLGTSDFTIEFWVNATSLNTYPILFAQDKSGQFAPNFRLEVNTGNSNKLTFFMGDGANNVVVNSSSSLIVGMWTHIAIVRTGNNYTIFMDGQSEGSSSTSGSINQSTNAFPFRIGARTNLSNTIGNPFNGTFDEFRIWNTVRTQAEIQVNLNNELSTETGLVASYNFNEGVANGNNTGVTTAADASGNGNDGTLNNFALTGTTSNWIGGEVLGDLTVSNNAPGIFPVGETIVIWTATDAAGKSASCNQIVTVNETNVVANAGTDGTITICEGTMPTEAELFAQLTDGPDTGGTWSGPVAGVYTYTVAPTPPCTESDTATVTLIENPLPAEPTGEDTVEVCQDVNGEPDYEYTYDGFGWTGSYQPDFERPWSYISLGRRDASGTPIEGSVTIIGDGKDELCLPGDTAIDNPSTVDGVGAELPDGKSLKIVNVSNENVTIKYWDLGIGILDPEGYECACSGTGVPDVILAPGETITVLRTGEVIEQVTGGSGGATETITATATAPAGSSVVWYDAETGGNEVATPEQVGAGTIMYWAAAVDDLTGCESATRFKVTLTVNDKPDPEVTNAAICKDDSYTWPVNGVTYTESAYVTIENDDCEADQHLVLVVRRPVRITSTQEDVVCFGGPTGSIDITVNEGVGNYTYAWSGPNNFSATTEDLSGLEAGVYDVTVTDEIGCENTAQVTVEVTCSTVLSVTAIELIDADNDVSLVSLIDGMVIDVSTLPTLNLSLEAFATDDVESVKFVLGGAMSHTQTESVEPYALYGDTGGGSDYNGSVFALGGYTITVTPYSGNSLGGTQGTPRTLSFTLVDAPVDNDGDGFTAGEDCDDNDPNINPGAIEVCDGIDNNCDGQIDEGLTTTYYADTDGDGYGDPFGEIQLCGPQAGYVTDNTDCNDTDAGVNPDAIEVCDGIDNNCDGNIDEGFSSGIYYADLDGDGFGDPNNSIQGCDQPAGFVTDNTDCDDTNANINPDSVWYLDADGDDFASASLKQCTDPGAGYTLTVLPISDCNDNDAGINPNATEVCDGVDNNCNGLVDGDETGVTCSTVLSVTAIELIDASNDVSLGPLTDGMVIDVSTLPTLNLSIEAFATDDVESVQFMLSGAMSHTQTESVAPYALYGDTSGGSDYNGRIFALGSYTIVVTPYSGNGLGGTQGTPRIVNFTLVDAPVDNDGDGFVAGVDCDDNDPNINPDAIEVCDGIDNNCDGQIDEGLTTTYYADTDGDGYGDPFGEIQLCGPQAGYVADNTDCNDTDAGVNPDAIEVCDGIDNNCDGNIDEGFSSGIYYADLDGDGFGDPNNSLQGCDQPAGFVTDNTDCDDTNANINPDSVWYLDADGDDFASASLKQCTDPGAGYTLTVLPIADCNDNDAGINPDATEVCDGIDNNCNGLVDGDESGVTCSSVLSVTGIELIDASNDVSLGPLTDGMVIDVSTLPTLNLSIEGFATDDVESMQFVLSGAMSHTQTESVEPYALYGDTSGGSNYNGRIFALGSYTIVVTPYSENGLGGTQGTPLVVNFELVDGGPLRDASDLETIHDLIKVNAWPNPSETSFNLELVSETELGNVKISVFDTSHKLIHSGAFDSKDRYVFGANFDSGVYTVKLVHATGVETVRIIKE